MHKRKTYQMDVPAMATQAAYEGKTVRLGQDAAQPERQRERAACWHSGFPWWILWLIWPLFGLVKWLVPLYVGATSAVFDQLSAAGAASIGAIGLIVVGLMLIGRRTSDER